MSATPEPAASSKPTIFSVGDKVVFIDEPKRLAYIAQHAREEFGDGPFTVDETFDATESIKSVGHPQWLFVKKGGALLVKDNKPVRFSGALFEKVE